MAPRLGAERSSVSVRVIVVSLACARELGRVRPAWGWLLAVLLAAPASEAAVPPAGRRAPGPTQETNLARLERFPPAFAKAAPTSLDDLRSMEQHVRALVARLSPSVVAVEIGDASGSGVVVSSNGLVLTAGHVSGRANREVRFTFPNGRTARGKTLGANRESDAGLLQITERGAWPCAELGELGLARSGDWVLAMGHPGGFDLKRSLVVRLGRLIQLEPEALRTDCTITGGDSGGPLFDMQGRVIGIHSYISGAMTANFHVPVTRFYEAWAGLAKGEVGADDNPPPRAYVGARSRDAAGVCLIEEVDADGPASRAGLRAGDMVLRVEGRDIRVAASFRRWVAEGVPGQTLNLEIKRGDRTLSLAVKLEPPPPRP